MEHDIKKLPKWAQKIIFDLEERIRLTRSYVLEKDIERKRIEAMIPWTEEGMDWFTIGTTKHEPYCLFVLSKDSAHPVCSLGSEDRLFIGRSNKTEPVSDRK